MGSNDGSRVGSTVVGRFDGWNDGIFVGSCEGCWLDDGKFVGEVDGFKMVGIFVCWAVVGSTVG